MNRPLSKPKTRNTTGTPTKRKPRKQAARKPVGMPSHNLREKIIFLTIEILSLAVIAVYAIIKVLGNAANWTSGTTIMGSLLPFTAGVLALILATSVFLIVWWQLRHYLNNHTPILIPTAALCLVLIAIMLVDQDKLIQSVSQFRTLVGGKEEASRVTLNHQVFAAYRRYNQGFLQKMILRAEPYQSAIADAAAEYDIDQNLLQGIAAAESSFNPRDSHDGGHGLFQITAVPKSVLSETRERLNTSKISVYDHRHNAFIAAATFKSYLAEMNNDVFLGLLAYNIGPANGGLRFIMKKYGVTDFVTIQPYLQLLPRDYPIRVLSYALGFRLWQQYGKLLAYEEGRNAMEIQRIGVPGLP